VASSPRNHRHFIGRTQTPSAAGNGLGVLHAARAAEMQDLATRGPCAFGFACRWWALPCACKVGLPPPESGGPRLGPLPLRLREALPIRKGRKRELSERRAIAGRAQTLPVPGDLAHRICSVLCQDGAGSVRVEDGKATLRTRKGLDYMQCFPNSPRQLVVLATASSMAKSALSVTMA